MPSPKHETLARFVSGTIVENFELLHEHAHSAENHVQMDSCKICGKLESEVLLGCCPWCLDLYYCSRECQQADWRGGHYEVCVTHPRVLKEVEGPRADEVLSPPKGVKGIAKPFTHLQKGTFLYDRPKMDVFRILIDSYRLRVHDKWRVEMRIDRGSIFAGHFHDLIPFERFLHRATRIPKLLPGWWNDNKQRDCARLGMDKSQWHDLHIPANKDDIVEYYDDPNFPLQLRLLGEVIERRGLGRVDGSEMGKLMASMEVDEWVEDGCY